MIRSFDYGHVMIPSMGPCKPYCQLVGLGSGVDEEPDVKGVWQCLGESREVFCEAIVHVTAVCVQNGHLSLSGLDHMRVTMTHVRDVVH